MKYSPATVIKTLTICSKLLSLLKISLDTLVSSATFKAAKNEVSLMVVTH